MGKTQKELVFEFNSFLRKRNLKGITTATFSRWENSINSPTNNMWDLLAEFMNTKSIVLKGALGLDEIVKIIQRNYIDTVFNNKKHESYLYSSIIDYLAGIGEINKNKIKLTKNDATSYIFWKHRFAPIFLEGQPLIWLITTKPVNLDRNTAEFLITEALNLLIIKRKDESKEFTVNLEKYQAYRDNQVIPKDLKIHKKPKETKFNPEIYSDTQKYIQYFTFLYPDLEERGQVIEKMTKQLKERLNDIKKNSNE